MVNKLEVMVEDLFKEKVLAKKNMYREMQVETILETVYLFANK